MSRTRHLSCESHQHNSEEFIDQEAPLLVIPFFTTLGKPFHGFGRSEKFKKKSHLSSSIASVVKKKTKLT
ncbi:hypothetical protein U6N69_12225, partial [Cutibacterium acnes]